MSPAEPWPQAIPTPPAGPSPLWAIRKEGDRMGSFGPASGTPGGTPWLRRAPFPELAERDQGYIIN